MKYFTLLLGSEGGSSLYGREAPIRRELVSCSFSIMASVHPSRRDLVPQDSRHQGRSRHRSLSQGRSQERLHGTRRSPSPERDGRRRSPEYEEYKGASGPLPWRIETNMYPTRGGENRHSNGGRGGSDYLTRSGAPPQRCATTV